VLQYKIDFDNLEWVSSAAGWKHKFVDQNNVRLRLVEYSAHMKPHWCEKGHYGYIISGEMEIEYPDGKFIYKPGDGIFIPAGADHRHKGKVLSDKVLIFFTEYI